MEKNSSSASQNVDTQSLGDEIQKEEQQSNASEGSEADFSFEATGDKDKYELSLESMLKSGVHFGHKKARWSPKMEQYIFGVRNGIHIIDLEKTLVCFEKALDYVDSVVSKNGIVLLVGTKKQAKDLVAAVAKKIGLPYVSERWLGGTFTNFNIIKKRLKYLVDSREALEKGKLADITKLERHKLTKRLDKIDEKMGGLVGMNRLPDVMIVLDVIKDKAAIDEAKKMGVIVVGLVDSNGDPNVVDYPIPANDDALSSLRYVLGVFMKRVIEARNEAAMNKGVAPASAGDLNKK